MKPLKILLSVILLALLPHASAYVFMINQSSHPNNVAYENINPWFNQSFTTDNPTNTSQFSIDSVSIYGIGSATTITVSVNNNTHTFPSFTSSLTGGAVGWQTILFPQGTSAIVLEKNSQYAFNITFPSSAVFSVYSDINGNPYSGGRAFDSAGSYNANSDMAFNLSMTSHDAVGSWKFNEGSGAYANDSSGFNNNGTLLGAPLLPTWATNLNNGSVNSTALSFLNSGNNVTTPNSSSLTIGKKDFTMGMWVKYNATNTSLQTVFADREASGIANAIQGIYIINRDGADEAISLETWAGTAVKVKSSNLADDHWHFVYATYTAEDNILKLYIDNVLSDSDSQGASSPVTTSNYSVIIGSNINGLQGFTGVVDEVKIFNYALNTSELTAEFQRFQPVPAYPVGGIILPAVYPPLQTSVTFSWYDTVYPADEIQIAEDVNFNIMVHDGFHSTDSATVNLDAGKTYYWRIKQFNSTTSTYGNTSLTQTFSISSAPAVSASGSAVQGIVYEIINGVQTPVSGSTVYLSNSTASFTFVTSSNGYFLFQNLAPNSTYSIYATNAPIYNPTSIFPITTTATAGTVTSNLLITRFFSPFVPNYVYEKFIVRNLFDTKFPGVTVNVFTDGDITPLATKTTDSMGQAVFQLIKDTYYRVEFSGGGLSSTIVIYTYGKEEEYEVLVLSGVPTTNVTTSQVSAVLSNSTVNSTFTNLTLQYNDSSLTTTQVNFFVYNNTNGSMTLISYQTFLATNNIFTGYAVNSGGGNSYVWGYNATNQYGTQSEAKGITFPSAIRTTLSSNIQNWISIILIVMLASMFSKRNVKQGAVVVPAVAFILSAFGWFVVNPIYPAACFILGVLYYMRRQEIQVAT